MPKVYAIIHDGTKVLVGSGGNSGDPPTLRGGYHLPGGTYNPNSKIISEKNPKNAAERELKEETGIQTIGVTAFTKAFNLKCQIPGGGEEEVMFVVAKVKSVDALSQNFQRPAVTNVHDEPFTSLIALLISDRNNANFSAAHRTEWFKAGLTYAYQNDFLK